MEEKAEVKRLTNTKDRSQHTGVPWAKQTTRGIVCAGGERR